MLTPYFETLIDDTGAPVPGAAFALSSLKTPRAVAISGVTLAAVGAVPDAAHVTPVDLGDGDYAFWYDPAVNGEALLKVTPSLAGHAFTGRNALLRVPMTVDTSNMALAASSSAANTGALTALASQVTDIDTTIHATPAPLNATNVDATFLAAVAGQVAGAVLATPANKLATDNTGRVAASNLPADYQQRGQAVTLPTGEDSTIVGDVQAGLTAQGLTGARAARLDNLDAAVSAVPNAAAAVLTASSGFQSAVGASAAAGMAGMVVDSSGGAPITYKQELMIQLAHLTDQFGTALTGGHLVVTYHKQDGSTPIQVATITQDATSGRPVVGGATLANLS